MCGVHLLFLHYAFLFYLKKFCKFFKILYWTWSYADCLLAEYYNACYCLLANSFSNNIMGNHWKKGKNIKLSSNYDTMCCWLLEFQFSENCEVLTIEREGTWRVIHSTYFFFFNFFFIFVLSLIFVWDLSYTSCDLVKLCRFTLNRCVCTSLRGEGRTQCDLMRSIWAT